MPLRCIHAHGEWCCENGHLAMAWSFDDGNEESRWTGVFPIVWRGSSTKAWRLVMTTVKVDWRFPFHLYSSDINRICLLMNDALCHLQSLKLSRNGNRWKRLHYAQESLLSSSRFDKTKHIQSREHWLQRIACVRILGSPSVGTCSLHPRTTYCGYDWYRLDSARIDRNKQFRNTTVH